jgi:hypothetical protein
MQNAKCKMQKGRNSGALKPRSRLFAFCILHLALHAYTLRDFSLDRHFSFQAAS